MERQPHTRRFPIGAEARPQGGVHFRVWAPRRKRVEIVLEGGASGQGAYPLQAEADGYFAGGVHDLMDTSTIAGAGQVMFSGGTVNESIGPMSRWKAP